MKKIITCFIAFAVLFTCASVGVWAADESDEAMLGDVDGNGRLNLLDATLFVQYLTGWDSAKEKVVLEACDCNGDGKLNLTDVTKLIRHIAGVDQHFDGPC